MKRSRNYSQETSLSSLDVEALTLQKPVHVSESIHTFDGTGENGNKEVVISGKARGHFKKHMLSLHAIEDILFPKVVRNIRTYGIYTTNALAGVTSAGSNETSTSANVIQQRVGGKQLFVSFLHLSLSNRLGYSGNPSVTSFVTDALNAQNINATLNVAQPTQASRPSVATLVTDPVGNLSGILNQTIYRGGSTTHTFYNTGNEEIWMEFFEVRPRRFLQAFETPLNTIAVDKIQNASKTTGYAYTQVDANGIYVNDQYIQPTNPQYTIEKNDFLFHEKFLCSKPKKIKVLGGETVKYVMKHPSFKITESGWWKSMISGGNASFASTSQPGGSEIDYAPFCTSWLLIRICGQLGSTDTGTASTQQGNFIGTGSATVGVNVVPFQLAHIQNGRHYTRASLWQKPYTEYFVDTVTQASGETSGSGNAVFGIDNPLTDTVVQMAV